MESWLNIQYFLEGGHSAMKHNPAFIQLVEEVRNRVRECSLETMRTMLAQNDSMPVIDVREDREVRKGIIPGAIHIGRGVLERDIESMIPDKNAEMVLYCGGGYRSVLAAENLQKMGYAKVWSLEGGIKAWMAAGYPLSSNESPEKDITR